MFGCLPLVFGLVSYPPGHILRSVFLWSVSVDRNLPVHKSSVWCIHTAVRLGRASGRGVGFCVVVDDWVVECRAARPTAEERSLVSTISEPRPHVNFETWFSDHTEIVDFGCLGGAAQTSKIDDSRLIRKPCFKTYMWTRLRYCGSLVNNGIRG